MVRLVSRGSTFPEGVGCIFYLTNFRKGARGLEHYLEKWKILGGGGYGNFLEPHNTKNLAVHFVSKTKASVPVHLVTQPGGQDICRPPRM